MIVEGTQNTSNQETIVSSQDFFADEDPSATSTPPPASDPVEQPAAQTQTETSPTPDAAPSAGATEDDPWADVDLADEPATTQAPVAESEFLQTVSQVLGLAEPPKTAEAIKAAIDQKVAQEVAIASQDPIRQLTQEIGLSDRELVRLELNASRSRFDTDETIEDKLAELEEAGRIQAIATELRTEREGKLTTVREAKIQEQQQYKQALDQAKRETWEKIDVFKDPEGRALPDGVKKVLHAYINSDQYINDLLTQTNEWHIQQAAMLHPKLGVKFKAMAEKVSQSKGASALIRELEHQTPVLGGGAATVGGSRQVSSTDFFND